jgi:Domain of unknown function (DUF4332)
MVHDWNYARKVTLWPYEELLKKLNGVLGYPVIRQAYNHSMPEASDFAKRLFGTSNIAAGKYPAPLITLFGHLHTAGVENWADLLGKIAGRESCEAFLESAHLDFQELIDVLNYLLRWAFPFYTATRELLDHDNPREMRCYPVFKQNQLISSFDLLEHGYTRARRRSLAKRTNLPLEFITGLIHRADIARLPYVRRKTILPVSKAGYDTVAKIASAGFSTMETDMETCFTRHGKSWDDYRSVIVLRGLISGTQSLPGILRS